MTACLGKSFNSHFKFFISSRGCNQKFFSILSPVSYKVNYGNNIDNRKFLKQDSNKLQCRYSSSWFQEFYINFYNSVTNSGPSIFLKNGLIEIHDFTGLPWWATLVSTTLAFRLFWGFPIGIYQQYIVAKLKLARIEVEAISKELKEKIFLRGKKLGWDSRKKNLTLFREVKQHWKSIVVKNNCHPFKVTILTLIQFPLWVLMSLTLRKFTSDITENKLDEMVAGLQFQVGGLPWCRNLTLPDSTLILPTLITLTTLTAIEINILSSTTAMTLAPRIFMYILRILSLSSFIISANVPSCVALFWATSAILAVGQNLLLLSPRFRRFLRIPKTPLDFDKPYTQIAVKAVDKYSNLGKKLTRFIDKK